MTNTLGAQSFLVGTPRNRSGMLRYFFSPSRKQLIANRCCIDLALVIPEAKKCDHDNKTFGPLSAIGRTFGLADIHSLFFPPSMQEGKSRGFAATRLIAKRRLFETRYTSPASDSLSKVRLMCRLGGV